MTVLAPYAADPTRSLGRLYAESPPHNRNEFQRDRDRIIHCNAFRRLEYKTQVFINHGGDLFRTRLTHSLEVAQVARTIAHNLCVNEVLVEAISLAHDLGHTPFGHAGQDELNACMQKFTPEAGGFEHNLQSLRIVDKLEARYATFDGLNLCFETREGILKHCSLTNARELGTVGARFLQRQRPLVEAQLADFADQIAYSNHDIDDGLRSGLITVEQLQQVSLFARHHEQALRQYPDACPRRVVAETIRSMINTLIVDLTNTTAQRIAYHAPTSMEAVREAPLLVGFSPEVKREADELKSFLLNNLYRHFLVLRMTTKAQRIVHDLFTAFLSTPKLLPPDYQQRLDNGQPRAIADYIAGMTDRYAIREHKRLFDMLSTPT